MLRVVENTLPEPHRSTVEQAVLRALNIYPKAATWDVRIVAFEVMRGFLVLVTGATGPLDQWIFDSPAEDIEGRIRRDLGEP